MDKQALKKKVIDVIDSKAKEIIQIGDQGCEIRLESVLRFWLSSAKGCGDGLRLLRR